MGCLCEWRPVSPISKRPPRGPGDRANSEFKRFDRQDMHHEKRGTQKDTTFASRSLRMEEFHETRKRLPPKGWLDCYLANHLSCTAVNPDFFPSLSLFLSRLEKDGGTEEGARRTQDKQALFHKEEHKPCIVRIGKRPSFAAIEESSIPRCICLIPQDGCDPSRRGLLFITPSYYIR